MLENITRSKWCEVPEKLLPRLSLRAWKRGPDNAELRVMRAGWSHFSAVPVEFCHSVSQLFFLAFTVRLWLW